jgi:TPP-dependent pyruvate/acetoin dehydrogenase alpha subunit
MATTKEKLIEMYTVMVRIRTFEERMTKEFKGGRVPGFLHIYSGEEAVAAGTCAHLRPDDYITSTHRGHGHAIAKGCKLDRMAAELYGKSTGYNRGKGGSMHLAHNHFIMGLTNSGAIRPIAGIVPRVEQTLGLVLWYGKRRCSLLQCWLPRWE